VGIVVLFTNEFKKDVKKLLSLSDLDDLAEYLQANPEAGDLIPSTGGVRKLRWSNPKNNKGKSGANFS